MVWPCAVVPSVVHTQTPTPGDARWARGRPAVLWVWWGGDASLNSFTRALPAASAEASWDARGACPVLPCRKRGAQGVGERSVLGLLPVGGSLSQRPMCCCWAQVSALQHSPSSQLRARCSVCLLVVMLSLGGAGGSFCVSQWRQYDGSICVTYEVSWNRTVPVTLLPI